MAVFDGFKMSKYAMDYAVQLTKVADAHLDGVFLDVFIYRSYSLVKMIKTYKNYGKKMKELDAKDKKKRDEVVQQFQKSCTKVGIHFPYTEIKVWPLMT